MSCNRTRVQLIVQHALDFQKIPAQCAVSPALCPLTLCMQGGNEGVLDLTGVFGVVAERSSMFLVAPCPRQVGQVIALAASTCSGWWFGLSTGLHLHAPKSPGQSLWKAGIHGICQASTASLPAMCLTPCAFCHEALCVRICVHFQLSKVVVQIVMHGMSSMNALLACMHACMLTSPSMQVSQTTLHASPWAHTGASLHAGMLSLSFLPLCQAGSIIFYSASGGANVRTAVNISHTLLSRG